MASRVFTAPLFSPSASISWTSGLEISSLDCGPSFWGARDLMGRRMADFLLLTMGGAEEAAKIVPRSGRSQQHKPAFMLTICRANMLPCNQTSPCGKRRCMAAIDDIDHHGGRGRRGAPDRRGAAARRRPGPLLARRLPLRHGGQQGPRGRCLRRRSAGLEVTRFDYSGHGRSGGDFNDGTITRWLEEALAVFALTHGPQVVIGSSMGGWLALLLNRAVRAAATASAGSRR